MEGAKIMGKTYLNRAEKDTALALAAFVAMMDDKIDYWAKSGTWPLTIIAEAEAAKAHIEAALDIMFNDLDQAERAKIIKGIAAMEVVVKYKEDAIREYNRIKALEEVTPVDTEDLYTIAEAALETCNGCDRDGQECNLRRILVKYDVPVFDENAQGCPYKSI
jgi:hypothetical protein